MLGRTPNRLTDIGAPLNRMAKSPGQRCSHTAQPSLHVGWPRGLALLGGSLGELAEKLGAKRDPVKRNHQFMRAGQVQSMLWSSIVMWQDTGPGHDHVRRSDQCRRKARQSGKALEPSGVRCRKTWATRDRLQRYYQCR